MVATPAQPLSASVETRNTSEDSSLNKEQTHLTDIDLDEESAISSEKCAYIAGWLIFRLQKIHGTCKDCNPGLLTVAGSTENMRFLKMKSIENSLVLPGEAVVKAVQKMEMVFDRLCNSERSIEECRGVNVSSRVQPAAKAAAASELKLHSTEHTEQWL
jgi:hypothetical protein